MCGCAGAPREAILGDKLGKGAAALTNEQLYLALGVPALVNAVLIGVLMAYINAKFEGLRGEVHAELGSLRTEMNAGFDTVNARFDTVNARFDTSRAELLRVEEVLDARLKHLEENRKS